MELIFYFQLIFNAKCDRKVLGIYRSGIYDWANVTRFSSNAAAAKIYLGFQYKKIGLSETDLFGQNHFRKLDLPSRPSK